MWLPSKGKRSLVGSQEEENQPTQIAWGSWPDGGDVQEMNGPSRTQSDWAMPPTDGTIGCDTVILASVLV